eukprot:TRINITY_DN355_c5_g1_i6.p1 TRINITY_DN355_c5_g1~~TRINITY_DN355_c5_g1_i6.p1  ORF type:complete len:904 (-),score=212.82 TRINITY_DN355_c5_g1_i6:216-2927(-)
MTILLEIEKEILAIKKDKTTFPAEIVIREFEIFGKKLLIVSLVNITNRKKAAQSDTKDLFIANMSHEIRTPLNGIIGPTQLLMESSLQKDQLELVEMIINSSKSLMLIVNDILDFSKLDSGNFQENSNKFSLLFVCEDLIDLFALKAQKKGLEIEIVVKPEDWKLIIQSDAPRLRQVLMNLIDNAIKFTDTGRVKIIVEVIIDDTDNNQFPKKSTIYFQVIDTGVGISAINQTLLFSPFMQVDNTFTRKHGGTGLGLAICHKIVTALHGTIGVISDVNKGSNFWFKIPCVVVKSISGDNNGSDANLQCREAGETSRVSMSDSTAKIEATTTSSVTDDVKIGIKITKPPDDSNDVIEINADKVNDSVVNPTNINLSKSTSIITESTSDDEINLSCLMNNNIPLVDDNIVILDHDTTLFAMLKSFGCHVWTFTTPEEFLSKVKELFGSTKKCLLFFSSEFNTAILYNQIASQYYKFLLKSRTYSETSVMDDMLDEKFVFIIMAKYSEKNLIPHYLEKGFSSHIMRPVKLKHVINVVLNPHEHQLPLSDSHSPDMDKMLTPRDFVDINSTNFSTGNGGQLLLVVEKVDKSDVTSLLRRLGYHVTIATTMDHVKTLIKERDFDFVLMHDSIPLGGPQSSRIIKLIREKTEKNSQENLAVTHTSIVAIVNLTYDPKKVKSSAKVDSIIQRPFSFHEIKSVLEKCRVIKNQKLQLITIDENGSSSIDKQQTSPGVPSSMTRKTSKKDISNLLTPPSASYHINNHSPNVKPQTTTTTTTSTTSTTTPSLVQKTQSGFKADFKVKQSLSSEPTMRKFSLSSPSSKPRNSHSDTDIPGLKKTTKVKEESGYDTDENDGDDFTNSKNNILLSKMIRRRSFIYENMTFDNTQKILLILIIISFFALILFSSTLD